MISSRVAATLTTLRPVLLVLLLLLSGSIGVRTQLPLPQPQVYFEQALQKRLSLMTAPDEANLEKFCPTSTDLVAMRVLQSYGSMFVAGDEVKLPAGCVSRSEGEVRRFQLRLEKKSLEINGIQMELQAPAMTALQSSVEEAAAVGLSITPLDGAIAGARSYGDTMMLWNSRVFPALEFWIRRGRLSADAREEIGRLDLQKKIEKIIEWESQGIYFSTDRARSIFTSTAPPGTSQHLYLAAFDVSEYWNPQ